MDVELIAGVGAVPTIVAVVHLCKKVGFPPKWAGILAAGLGIVAGVGYTLFASSDLYRGVIAGLTAGLAAAGAYSSVKNATGD